MGQLLKGWVSRKVLGIWGSISRDSNLPKHVFLKDLLFGSFGIFFSQKEQDGKQTRFFWIFVIFWVVELTKVLVDGWILLAKSFWMISNCFFVCCCGLALQMVGSKRPLDGFFGGDFRSIEIHLKSNTYCISPTSNIPNSSFRQQSFFRISLKLSIKMSPNVWLMRFALSHVVAPSWLVQGCPGQPIRKLRQSALVCDE